MRMLLRSVLVLVGLTLVACATADVGAECSDAVDQLELTRCFSELADSVEDEMHAAMNLLRELGPDKCIECASSSFVSYRDNYCEYRASLYGEGSMRETSLAHCQYRLTSDFLDELNSTLVELGPK